MFFVVETKKNPIVKKFCKETKERMLIRRFGVGEMDIAMKQTSDDRYRLFVMAKPLISNTMLYGATFVLIPAVLFGWGVWGYAVPAFFVSLKFFETDYFGTMVLKYALDKAGYKDDIIRIPLSRLVEEAMIDGTK